MTVTSNKLFNIDTDIEVPAFSKKSEHVPTIDDTYCFHKETTEAILAGIKYNRNVLIQGYHGTGKSTHIEQVAARLNYPCFRINLDGHISRLELVGKDVIKLVDGKQVTEFQEGIIPWALQQPMILVLDEYDAGRPDVMFVIQRLLESDGKFTLIDQNKVIKAHPDFRLFATSNTIGLGDSTGMYQGTNMINQGQIDRWNIIANLNYLPEESEIEIVLAKNPKLNNAKGKKLLQKMVILANMTRTGFASGDISTVMSPRTVISWAENYAIFDNCEESFQLSFLNRCDEEERSIIAEYYQRCFDKELDDSIALKEVA